MRIAIGVEYLGTHYHGWQYQQGLTTIQGEIESALSQVADQPVTITCAGRTDAGVHAIGQVAHFQTEVIRPLSAWVMGTNTHLSPAIRILWAQEVSEEFHARYSATARRYQYIIYNSLIAPAIMKGRVTWHCKPLDETRMHAAAQYLIGEHDFSSYRGIDCQAKTPMREVLDLTIRRHEQWIVVDIKANAFLHHMVRNIVGVLLQIGEGKREPIWAKEVLEAKDRKVGGVTAPGDGLYLCEVDYPGHYNLPIAQSQWFYF